MGGRVTRPLERHSTSGLGRLALRAAAAPSGRDPAHSLERERLRERCPEREALRRDRELLRDRERWCPLGRPERERRRPPRPGTLSPSRRASFRPIAIACSRLFTLFPDRPERSVPCLRSCIALSTLFEARRP